VAQDAKAEVESNMRADQNADSSTRGARLAAARAALIATRALDESGEMEHSDGAVLARELLSKAEHALTGQQRDPATTKADALELRNQLAALEKLWTLNRREMAMTGNERTWTEKHRKPVLGALVGVIVICLVILAVRNRAVDIWSGLSFEFDGFHVTEHKQGWGELRRDRGVSGELLRVAGKTWESGLGTHAESRITIAFDRDAKTFSGYCGYPDYVNSAKIQCRIMVGDEELFSSRTLDSDAPLVKFNVPVDGLKSVVLEITSRGDGIGSAHGAWLDLKLE